jgi:hypothetical protein
LSGFSSNCFRKIEAHAKVRPAMTPAIDPAQAMRRRTSPAGGQRIVHWHHDPNGRTRDEKKKWLRVGATL